MNEWSVKRKRVIFSLIFLTLIVLVGMPLFFLFYQAPSCFDGKQNGDETGIDCGGSCQLICTDQTLPLISKGDPRVLETRPGVYNVVALAENPNILAEILHARYTINLFEESSFIPVKTIESEVFVPSNGPFIVFEGPIDMGERHPIRVTLEWHTDSFIWQRNTKTFKDIVARDAVLTREDIAPRVSAMLVNNSQDHVSNIELTVLVSGEDGNLIAASKTFVEDLPKGASSPVVFNWPAPFNIKEDICSFPVDVALVIDRSGSMAFLGNNPPQPLTEVKNTARYFINQLGINDRYTLISFANEASNPIDAELGVDLDTIHKTINAISIATESLQNTNIGAGILSARAELNSVRHRENTGKALVLLTDGTPTLPVRAGISKYPETYALESAEIAKRDDIGIYTIGLGKDVDMNLLRTLATALNDAYFAPSTEELNDIYNQIATKICKKTPAVIDIYMRILPNKSFLR